MASIRREIHHFGRKFFDRLLGISNLPVDFNENGKSFEGRENKILKLNLKKCTIVFPNFTPHLAFFITTTLKIRKVRKDISAI